MLLLRLKKSLLNVMVSFLFNLTIQLIQKYTKEQQELRY
ncbi:Uncharacterised protein [Mycobacterium tuberculosis]|nr:Uncharacterised protein [Mycobacterium tuberculosis]CKT80996.1 Uncharacterised protein [Mycobacterium tuberculosis]CKW34861.1 Uncharacterised protein [Mycobacterium tuberculosis]